MSDKLILDRRAFLTGSALTGGCALLGGCSSLTQLTGTPDQPGGGAVLALEAGLVPTAEQLRRLDPALERAVREGMDTELWLLHGPSAAGARQVVFSEQAQGGKFHAVGANPSAWERSIVATLQQARAEAAQALEQAGVDGDTADSHTVGNGDGGADPVGLVRRSIARAQAMPSKGPRLVSVVVAGGAQRTAELDVVAQGLTVTTASELASRLPTIDTADVQVQILGVGSYPGSQYAVDPQFADALMPFWRALCPGCDVQS
ncbi:hypothetical protein GCM10027586_04420 [Kineococcus gypseus]|uniref:twin-arginine translocation signal domain-containing protein n=1 Tax=Kineococcus gypseus TaxID=1637102 RepID=UPI003D7EB520